MAAKKRLDQEIFDRGLTESRSRAQALIMQGKVKVAGEKMTKAGFAVNSETPIEIEEDFPYVSRGALKLLKAVSNNFHCFLYLFQRMISQYFYNFVTNSFD